MDTEQRLAVSDYVEVAEGGEVFADLGVAHAERFAEWEAWRKQQEEGKSEKPEEKPQEKD